MIDTLPAATIVEVLHPSDDYVEDLSRCGMELRDWRETAASLGDTERSAKAPLSVYKSWSDSEMGVFGTCTGNGPVLIDAEMSADMIAFAIPLDASRTFNLSGQRVHDSKGLGIFTLPKGSRLQVSTAGNGLRSVTLMVRCDVLRPMCEIPHWSMPADMLAILAQRDAKLMERRLPVPLRQAAEAILAGPCHEPFAPMFYHAKTLELLWLMLEYLRTDCAGESHDTISDASREGVERVRRFIDAEFMHAWTIETLAQLAGMNRTKLRALFKHIYGITIFEYRTEVTMHRADSLLRVSDASIAEIGFCLGYSDTSSFNTAFKRFYGCPPGKLRGRRLS